MSSTMKWVCPGELLIGFIESAAKRSSFSGKSDIELV
jgi:hypothetical protein